MSFHIEPIIKTQSMGMHAAISRIHGNTVLYDFEGPVTLGQLIWAIEEHLDIVNAIKQEHPRWGAIIQFHKSSIASQDSFDAAFGKIDELKAQEAVPHCAAFVIRPDVEGYGTMEAAYAQLHVTLGNIYKAHESLDSAISWTNKQLTK